MIYEVINPSDPYTIVTDDFRVAAVAACVLGNGAYGLASADGSQEMPPMLFGGEHTWFPQAFGKSFEGVLSEVNRADVAACLETIVLCGIHERRAYDEALALVEDAERREELRRKQLRATEN